MKARDLLLEYYSYEDDKSMTRKLTDTRRPKLTLKHLNKLRKIKELRKAEEFEHSKFVKQMYGQAFRTDSTGTF